jgi:transposase
LANLRNERYHNDEATIALALQGNWREDHLFALKQAMDAYQFYLQQLAEVDKKIEEQLKTFEDKSQGKSLRPQTGKKKRASAPGFDAQGLLHRMNRHRPHRGGWFAGHHRAYGDRGDGPGHESLAHGETLHLLADALSGRLRARLGAPKAITATARKLAIIIYNMLKYGKPYVDQGVGYYEQQYRATRVKNLRRRAAHLGFDLVEAPTGPSPT